MVAEAARREARHAERQRLSGVGTSRRRSTHWPKYQSSSLCTAKTLTRRGHFRSVLPVIELDLSEDAQDIMRE